MYRALRTIPMGKKPGYMQNTVERLESDESRRAVDDESE